MSVHRLRPGDQRADVRRADRHHGRKSDRRIHGITAADQVPEAEHVRAVNADFDHILRGESKMRHHFVTRRRRPELIQRQDDPPRPNVFLPPPGHARFHRHPGQAGSRQHLFAVRRILRVEQLYPWPADELVTLLAGYPNAAEVVWLQEEPANAGAWEFVQPRLLRLLDGRLPLRLIARPRRASPAEGTMAMHLLSQAALLERAFETMDDDYAR